MPTCVPIKELKSTTSFAEMVEGADGPVTVTRNGREAFVVLRTDDYDALRLEAARAALYRSIDEAEGNFAAGDCSDAAESQARARAAHGL